MQKSELRTCCDKSLACGVGLVFCKVLDKSTCEIFRFLVPIFDVCVGVTRIENLGCNAVELGGHFKVEERNGLCGCFVDVTVENCVDNAASVLDGDTLARAVPTGVDKVCLCTALLHFLDELFRIFGGMEFKECLTEACREGRRRLGYATLRACEFCGETGQEVVLSLLGSENGHRGQHSECVCGQEDDVLCRGCCGDGAHDVFDVIDRIGNTSVSVTDLSAKSILPFSSRVTFSSNASRLIAL